MTSIIITGANRGIGLGLVRGFLDHSSPPKILIAACRNPDKADELKEISAKHDNLHVIKLDVTNIDSFPDFVNGVANIVGETGLNVLINNAAIKAGTGTCKTLDEFTWQEFQENFMTNCTAPVFLTRALLPLIKKAAAKNAKKTMGISKAAILNMSSVLGSVSLNTTGKYLGYRESKAALNQWSRSLIHEVANDEILVCSLHPGWVRTDMGGKEAPLSVEESISGLINLIYNLDQSHHDGFLAYSGEVLKW